MAALPIGAISLGNRHRKDMGDIDGLARSIEAVGLLHPVVVTPAGMLIAGERRLAALRRLGWAEVPVTEVDLEEITRGEFAENADRKDFLPSEIDAIRRALIPVVATPVGRPANPPPLAPLLDDAEHKIPETFRNKPRFQTEVGDLNCHLIDFPLLKEWFWAVYERFPIFGPLETLNRSMGRVTPIADVRAALKVIEIPIFAPKQRAAA